MSKERKDKEAAYAKEHQNKALEVGMLFLDWFFFALNLVCVYWLLDLGVEQDEVGYYLIACMSFAAAMLCLNSAVNWED